MSDMPVITSLVITDGDRSPTHTPQYGSSIALYAFHPFTDSELSEIARACEMKGGEHGGIQDYIVPAPTPHFLAANATIENVVTYHRALTSSRRYDGLFDPNYFAIAKSSNWKTEGILTVLLDEFELKTITDDGEAFRRGWDSWMFVPREVGAVFMNLQIANMNWMDFTEAKFCQPEGQAVDERAGNNLLESEEEQE